MTSRPASGITELSMQARLVCALVLLALAAISTPAQENWPELRGPHRDGHSDAKKLPLVWSETNNVTWKTAIHDLGWSSPVVWGDQIWVTTATDDGRHLFAVCVDSRTGKILHDVKVFDTESPAHIASVNSYASPTSAIEAGDFELAAKFVKSARRRKMRVVDVPVRYYPRTVAEGKKIGWKDGVSALRCIIKYAFIN